MNATEEDVRECYRVILGREAENDEVVDHHVRMELSALQLAARFADSREYRIRHFCKDRFSISKCFEVDYLAYGLDIASRISIFSHHYQILARDLSAKAFVEISQHDLTVLKVDCRERYEIKICTPETHYKEGELLIRLEVSGQTLYHLGFTFAPARAFGLEGETVALITRLQGVKGSQTLFRQAVSDWDGVAPSVLLYEAVRGVSSAARVRGLVGVSAARHVSCAFENAAPWRRSYDQFFESHGFAALHSGFYCAPLNPEKPASAHLSAPHRKRAERRRELREEVAQQAGAAWTSFRPTLSQASETVAPLQNYSSALKASYAIAAE